MASGQGGDPRYPEGTIRRQLPHFRRRGLDLRGYFPGTLNVDVTPQRVRLVRPRATLREVAWAPGVTETFSFADVWVEVRERAYVGLLYVPHPETKPEHPQPPGVVEVLAPAIPGLGYGTAVALVLDPAQVAVEAGGGP
ncbi:MAG: hypothetical protein R3362_01200 [Rhodothermales bacterium]|nr:hypothetical protein [Rhodothermales bacterium]